MEVYGLRPLVSIKGGMKMSTEKSWIDSDYGHPTYWGEESVPMP